MPAADRTGFLARPLLHLADLHRQLLPAYFALLGPRAAYALTAAVARLLYRILPPLRERSLAQCRAALPHLSDAHIESLAARAFVHRAWDLTDLLLAERLLHPGTYARYGGRVPQPHLAELLAAQRRGQPAILVTAYYGPFDLLPVFLGYNGVAAAAVYLPHANAAFDAMRRRVRARSGCELVPVERALARMPEILAAGGTIALVADHHVERGIPATFLGLPTRVSKAVGLLAWRFNADVVVAGIRRVGPFRFEIVVEDVFKHPAWAGAPDPVTKITERYLRALERLIRRDPSQYVWLNPRWGPELAGSRTALP